MRIIKCEDINFEFDFDKACYDLALIYAKFKLSEEYAPDKHPMDIIKGNAHKVPIDIERQDYILTQFLEALGYFANRSEEDIKAMMLSEEHSDL